MTRPISTDLNVLIRTSDWEHLAPTIPATLAERGYDVESIHADLVDLTCEPDNMLVNQYAQIEGRAPAVESLHRIVVNGTSDLALKDATKAVVAALPPNSYWYGTSNEGATEPGVSASCAWQHGGS